MFTVYKCILITKICAHIYIDTALPQYMITNIHSRCRITLSLHVETLRPLQKRTLDLIVQQRIDMVL